RLHGVVGDFHLPTPALQAGGGQARQDTVVVGDQNLHLITMAGAADAPSPMRTRPRLTRSISDSSASRPPAAPVRSPPRPSSSSASAASEAACAPKLPTEPFRA